MSQLSALSRSSQIAQMKERQFDLVIVGGGITGAGVARDAALRGMSVALVEASDFASGTSSRSSKLIHGGIRYLENFEFKLVFEALSERHKLFNIAPHMVHPLRFMIPLYRGGRVGMFKMGLGMWLYDALSLFQAPQMHERLNSEETLKRMPTLKGENLLGSYVYSDAYMDDDRLTLETLRSAHSAGALTVNYTKAVGLKFDEQGYANEVLVKDLLGGSEFAIKAHHVVSTVGPWTDHFGSSVYKKWEKILRPTKGVHLTFAQERLPLSSAVVMGAEERIVFGIPRHEMVIVGTTDTDYPGDPSEVSATPEDIRYLLGVVERYFPGAQIKEKDIIASYAGVRPLVKDDSSSAGKTSREHTIFTDEHRVTFVAGGKYTTYRRMSQEIVDKILKFRSHEKRAQWARCFTNQPLNPHVTTESYTKDILRAESEVSFKNWKPFEKKLLVERHGAEAFVLAKKLDPQMTYWQVEAFHALETTMCLGILDFYTRRVPLMLAHEDHGLSHFSEIAAVFKDYLDMSEDQIYKERSLLEAYLGREFGWRKKV